jgi:uncharacterized lipoprotein YmbA
MVLVLRLLMLTVVLTVGGCASSPPVRFYGLHTASDSVTEQTGSVIIGVGPIGLPDYLDRPQIVIRGSGNRLSFSEFDRWAEPLERSFNRAVAGSLDGMLDGVVVTVFPQFAERLIDVRVVGRVFQFDTDESGLAVLDVQWAAGNTHSDEPLIAVRRSRYEVQAQAPENFDSLVGALNEAVIAFSRDVATTLEGRL